MKLSTITRILTDRYWNPQFRHTYWQLAAFAKEAKSLLFHTDTNLRQHVRMDLLRYAFGVAKPVTGQAGERARAAVDWLLRAQSASPDDGVSLGYFPCDGIYHGWRPSYPETTGYIITSLFRFAERFDEPLAKEAAIRMAHWEVSVQMPSGAVQGGPVTSPDLQTPAAFNTGMVLDGWCTAYQDTQAPAFLGAARKAADFLLNDLNEEGYFETNGEYVSVGEIKTYTCLCAWALYRFGVLAEDGRYCEGAIRSIEAALKQQQSNGWFAHNCLSRSEAPLTHTIGYALQGILEVGVLSGRDDFQTAVRRGIDPLLEKIAPDGYLPGRFYADWEPGSFSSCLTGNAQIALVCFRLAEVTGETRYATSANRLLDFLKSLQARDLPNPALNGAIGGSFPLLGEYMRSGYPNWATKYFLDALLL
jgi:hypothetical protein